ncbi:MAG: hypothetical protein ACRD5G_14480 [Candidatus Acidiferrales bacterium]
MSRSARDALLLVMLALGAVLLHGYHVGVQDQAIYLPAIKKQLEPALYPHDAEFFLSQTRWMLFDEAVAWAARVTGSLEWVLLCGQSISVFLVLLGCLRLARVCFAEVEAQWAAVCTVAAMLSLPATGTLIPLVDNYFHPRGLATAAILLVWPAALLGQPWWIAGVALALPFHPMMALTGGFHLLVQWWKPRGRLALALAIPLLALMPQFATESEAWRAVLESRRHFFLLRWTWYEWVGVIVPVAFLWWTWRRSKNTMPQRAHVAARLLVATGAGVAVALLISILPGLERLLLAQPMRVLHLTYIFFFLLLGGWIGQAWLGRRPLRWLVFFAPVCAVMFYVQLRTFEGSAHVDWPGAQPRNAWVRAFTWARENTPSDAKFALDPNYMQQPGEDYFGFRAFAERSALADNVKDRAVAALAPDLAAAWQEQTSDLAGWEDFSRDDFLRLRRKYGVTWAVTEASASPNLPCPYSNHAVRVCRIE